ncbi:MAG: hypothetical protein WKF91_10540 [Segetibacter sp.]
MKGNLIGTDLKTVLRGLNTYKYVKTKLPASYIILGKKLFDEFEG